MKDPMEMTIVELKEYINAMSNEEIDKFAEEFEVPYDNDLDVLDLLSSSRLYDYLQYKNGGNATIEL